MSCYQKWLNQIFKVYWYQEILYEATLLRVDKLYNTLLMLHAFLPYKLGSGLALPMLKITLELTYQCNLRCTFCFQQGRKERDELSADEFIKLIASIPKFSLITFTGGEPLLKRDALKIINYALETHRCNVITNGVMMTENHIQVFVDKRLLLLGVSIDGIGQSHDQQRGMKGAYDTVIHNLKQLQEYKNRKRAKYPLLDIKTVITKENVSTLEEIYQCAQNMDADFLTLSLQKVSNIQFQANFINDLKDSRLYASLPIEPYIDLGVLAKHVSYIIKKSSKMKTKLRLYPMMLGTEGIETYFNNGKKLSDQYKPCFEPWSGMQISPAGDAYPCLAYRVGNVRESNLMSIYNSTKFREFRNKLRTLGLFPGCAGCCYLREKSLVSFALGA